MKDFLKEYAPALLVALPPLFLVACLALFTLDFPYLDQWEFVPLLQKSHEGALGFGDFWAQHNEHRPAFPRAVMLGLAYASDWDVRWEIATNLLLAFALFTFLFSSMRRTARGRGGTRWLAPLLSLLVFSLGQWENWFLGWQLQLFMNLLAVVLGFWIVATSEGRWHWLAGAMLMGVLATYSFANGLLFWPLGLLGILVLPAENKRKRAARAACWALVSATVTASYLWDYQPPGYHPSTNLVFENPDAYMLYILKYMGAPLAGFSELGAAIAGAVGCTAFLSLAVWAIVKRPLPWPMLLFLIGLAGYAIGSAKLTGLGRLGFGSEQAMSPRYVTFADLLWIANLGLGCVFVATSPKPLRTVAGAFVLCVAALVFATSLHGAYRWTERYHYRIEARDELLHGDEFDLLRRIHPEPEKIIERRPFLRRHGLSIFGSNTG